MKIQTTTPGNGSSFSHIGALTPSSLGRNRALLVRVSVVAVALIVVAFVLSIRVSKRSQAARSAFNDAMDVYDAPIQQPGQPAIPNVKTYPSAATRARDANPLFSKVAAQYGSFKAGENARYFAGLTAEDMGNAGIAEADLKKASGSRDTGVAALANMALASLYSTTGRAAQAAALYRSLIAHPTITVSANAARLALADSEQAANPQAARELYAKVKDSDKTTVAGQIAAQKLGGK